MFLGDTTRHGLTGVAVSGFILAVASAVALARFGEAGEQPLAAVEGEAVRDRSRAATPV